MDNKKDNRGGARPGAGRPKGDSQMISFRAPGALAERLNEMENRTDFIRKSISQSFEMMDEALAAKSEVKPAAKE